MMSFRKTLNIFTIALLLLLTGTLTLNFTVIRTGVHSLSLASQKLQEINTEHTKTDLPMRVIENIFMQLPVQQNGPDKLLRLSDAYKENYRTLINQSYVIADDAAVLSDGLSVPIRWLPHSLIHPYDDLLQSSAEFSRNMRQFHETVSTLLPSVMPEKNQDISAITTAYTRNTDTLAALNSAYHEASEKMLRTYMWLVTLVLLLTLLLAGSLSMMLFRTLNKNIRYILGAIRMLSSHRYNASGLPQPGHFFKEERDIKAHVGSVLREQEFLVHVKQVASKGYIVDEILEHLFYSIQGTLATDRVGIAFVDYQQERIIAEHGIANYGTVLLGPGFDVPMSQTSLTELIRDPRPLVTPDIPELLSRRPASKSLKLLVREGIRSNMIFPLVSGDKVFAFLFFSSIHLNNFTPSHVETGRMIALELGPILDKTYLTKTIFSRITNTFSSLVEKKDNETGDHIQRMVAYSAMLAKALMHHDDPDYRTTSHFVRDIENNASVHDIGKVGIPDHILKKPGKLDPEEWEVMKTHAGVGGDIFADLKESLRIFNHDFYKTAENIARHHHERWDGTGYPSGLSGKYIPLEARIVAVADVFDALTSPRVYKPAFSVDTSFRMMAEAGGTHLDPELVRIFLSLRPDIELILLRTEQNKDTASQ